MDRKQQKNLELARYKSQLLEAELAAIKRSRAYRLAQKAGSLKAQALSNPYQLGRRALRVLAREPQRLLHMQRTLNNSAVLRRSVAEQMTKYQEWILLHEPDEAELDLQRKASSAFKQQPLISILTPVFNPPVDVLEELIQSVLDQTYPGFELCLGDFGDDPEVRTLLTKYAKLDPRVKLHVYTENRGIARNSNTMLENVTGEFIALLDHDDTLAPNALYENVVMLNDKPYDCLYSDKDMIDEHGNRFSPLFKPQWSPDMMLNINYLTHLNVMRTSIIRKIGGWDPETNGAQDWDLFLRVAAQSKLIGHVPHVLYHWRVIASSTAMSIDTKPYALAGQRRSVDKYLAEHGVAATSYHQRTELFLRWDEQALPKRPTVFVFASSVPQTLRMLREIRQAVAEPRIVVLADECSKSEQQQITAHGDVEVIAYYAQGMPKALAAYLHKHPRAKGEDDVALFVRDDIRFSKRTNWYANLVGWLAMPEIAATCGRLVDRHDLIVASGGVITPTGMYVPLFNGMPRYYQSYIGNAEWVRDLSVLTPTFCATRLSLLAEFAFEKQPGIITAFDEYFLRLSTKSRLVMNPHALGSVFEGAGEEVARPIPSLQKYKSSADYRDPFSNPNVSAKDPMRLFEGELLAGVDQPVGTEPVDRYQHDATILADTFDITQEEIEVNRRIVQNLAPLKNPSSAAIFVPAFDAVYAGLVNIFSFAEFLSQKKKLHVTFYVLKADTDASEERGLVTDMFPGLAKATFKAITPTQAGRVGAHDIGVATQWSTTFVLARAQKIRRKCYFIQDNEANFYPKGSVSSLVDLGYRFGFMALPNTDGLLKHYQKEYGGSGIVIKSRVSLSAYHPRKDLYYTPAKPYKVFFYARPNMPRNAFELGIAGLKRLKQTLGDDVEVITAGAPWDATAFGVDGLFTNLGKIAYEAVPKLYRSVDAGLMFMFSGHPGVTASELMASGCPVVVNEYDDPTWHELYQHEKTCLVSLPTASEVARNLQRLLTEPKLRKTLIDGGLAVTAHFYDGYEASLEAAYKAVLNGKPSHA